MGTRLYPNTTNPSKLERLARVSPGTAKLVPFKKELEKYFLKMREGATFTGEDGREWPVDPEYEFFKLFSGSDVDTYEGFLLFGWGKFDLDLVPNDQDRYGGETTDTNLMFDMLLSSSWWGDFDAAEVIKLSEGFHWV
jgi:hypothetical protein